jgi:hypothetical protein
MERKSLSEHPKSKGPRGFQSVVRLDGPGRMLDFIIGQFCASGSE